MKAKDILELLDRSDYQEVLKAIVMLETGHGEEYAEKVVEAFLEDNNSTAIFDLIYHL